jgi:hypothetical protein
METEGRPLKDKWGSIDRADYTVPVVELRHTLAEVAQRNVFFTPALMLQAGGFDRDPVALAAVTQGLEREVRAYDCPVDIFKDVNFGLLPVPRGTQQVNWNRRLYFVDKDNWPKVRDYILSIAWMHPERGIFTTVMTVVDIFMYKPAQKILSISCFQPRHNNNICVLECTSLEDVHPRPVWRACDSFKEQSLVYGKKPK